MKSFKDCTNEKYQKLIDEVSTWGKGSPLAVGTKVFMVDRGKVVETEVVEVLVGSSGVKFRLGKNSTYFTALSALGKRVFFSEEGAVLSSSFWSVD